MKQNILSSLILSSLYFWITILAVVMSICGTFFVFYDVTIQRKQVKERFTEITGYCEVEYPSNGTFASIDEELISRLFDYLNQEKSKNEMPDWKVSAALMDTRIKELSSRVGGLEDALMITPTKALSVPLLKKDIESLDKIVAYSNIEIERVFTMMLWCVESW